MCRKIYRRVNRNKISIRDRKGGHRSEVLVPKVLPEKEEGSDA